VHLQLKNRLKVARAKKNLSQEQLAILPNIYNFKFIYNGEIN
jgi:hypothetical protein